MKRRRYRAGQVIGILKAAQPLSVHRAKLPQPWIENTGVVGRELLILGLC
jgi:hypothetical protein